MMQKKWRVLITLSISQTGLRMLEKYCEVEISTKDVPLTKGEVITKVKDKHALCCGADEVIDTEVMDAAPNLKIIARFGVGYDNVDVEAATKRGILVTNTPGVLTEAVAEMTWCLVLSLSRHVVQADAFTRRGSFKRSGPQLLMGTNVEGKTLGIVGAGKIGTAVAKKSLGFKMEILYYDPVRNEELEKIGGKRVTLDYLLGHSDFVSLHVSLTPDTVHMIRGKQIGLMKKTAYLINTSRGQVVDEGALVRALENKQIAGAALDVYENEPRINQKLLQMRNVVLTPHLGSCTKETWDAMAVMMAKNCLAVLSGEKPPHLVNVDVLQQGKKEEKMILLSSTRPNQGHYKPNVTSRLLEDLQGGEVVFGTMFREFTFLNRTIKEGWDLVKKTWECGYRFLVMDCEHKAFNPEILAEFAERAHEMGISIWIRPEQTSEPPLSMYADIGFSGFMVPNVNYPEEAQFAVDRVYFPPVASPTKRGDRGRRGFSLGDIPRDEQKFKNIKDGERYVNNNTLVIIQTEHPIGIKNLANILSINGVCGTIVGTNDLARGIAQQRGNEHLIKLDFSAMYRHNLMIEAYKTVGKICQRKRKHAGIHFTEVDETDLIKRLVYDFGYQILVLGRDENFDNPQFTKILK